MGPMIVVVVLLFVLQQAVLGYICWLLVCRINDIDHRANMISASIHTLQNRLSMLIALQPHVHVGITRMASDDTYREGEDLNSLISAAERNGEKR